MNDDTRLKSLTFFQFRNLEDQTLTIGKRVVGFVGANGQGKTNVLEGVYLLSVARSFRTSRSKELVRWGCEAFSVFGKLVLQGHDLSLGLSLENGERSGFVNGEKVPGFGDFVGRLPVVAMSPADLALVKGGPEERRRFLDKHLVDIRPAYYFALQGYQRILRNKQELLKSGRATLPALRAWNELLAAGAAEIVRYRMEFAAKLQSSAATLYAGIAPGDEPLTVRLSSRCSTAEDALGPGEILGLLEQLLVREQEQRRILFGPHRDDLVVELGGRDSRAFASQGQSKTIALVLKLAALQLIEAQRGHAALLLLDDIDAELDPARREAFYPLIRSSERQVLLTGTELRGVTSTIGDVEILQVAKGRFSAP